MFKVDVKNVTKGRREGKGRGPAWVWGFDVENVENNSKI